MFNQNRLMEHRMACCVYIVHRYTYKKEWRKQEIYILYISIYTVKYALNGWCAAFSAAYAAVRGEGERKGGPIEWQTLYRLIWRYASNYAFCRIYKSIDIPMIPMLILIIIIINRWMDSQEPRAHKKGMEFFCLFCLNCFRKEEEKETERDIKKKCLDAKWEFHVVCDGGSSFPSFDSVVSLRPSLLSCISSASFERFFCSLIAPAQHESIFVGCDFHIQSFVRLLLCFFPCRFQLLASTYFANTYFKLLFHIRFQENASSAG